MSIDNGSRNVFTRMGARNYAVHERENNDFYASPANAIPILLGVETFAPNILEPGVGIGSLANPLIEAGYKVRGLDIIDRGWQGVEICDFLSFNEKWDGSIVGNPPYKKALEFVTKALDVVTEGNKVAMLLKLLFLEGKARKKLFLAQPPKTVYVSSSRLNCARNGDFEHFGNNSAIAYCWVVWEKGFQGNTTLKWIN